MSHIPRVQKSPPSSAAYQFKVRYGLFTESNHLSEQGGDRQLAVTRLDQELVKTTEAFFQDRFIKSARSTAGLDVFHEHSSRRLERMMFDHLQALGFEPAFIRSHLSVRWESNVPLGALLINAQGDCEPAQKSVDFLMRWDGVEVFIVQTKFPIFDLASNKHTSYHSRSGEAQQLRDANHSATVYSVVVVPEQTLSAKAKSHSPREDVFQLVPTEAQARALADDDIHFFTHFTQFTPELLALSSKEEARSYVEGGGAVLADVDSVVKALVDDMSRLMPSIAQRIVEHVRSDAPLLTGKRRTAPTPSMLLAFRQKHGFSVEDAQLFLTTGDWAAYERDEGYMILDTWRVVQLEQEKNERKVADLVARLGARRR